MPETKRTPSPGAGGRGADSLRRESLGPPGPPVAESEELARFLAVDLSAGLTSADVESRRAQVGPNTLRGGGPPPWRGCAVGSVGKSGSLMQDGHDPSKECALFPLTSKEV